MIVEWLHLNLSTKYFQRGLCWGWIGSHLIVKRSLQFCEGWVEGGKENKKSGHQSVLSHARDGVSWTRVVARHPFTISMFSEHELHARC